MLLEEVESGLGTATRDSFEYVGAKEVSDRVIFLHEHWLDFSDNFSHLSDQIAEVVEKSQRFPVVCLSWNYYQANEIKSILDQTLGNKNYFILLTDPKHDTDINTALWPHFLIAMHPMKNFQLQQPKKYRISYLSGRVRYHRLKLWQEVKDQVRPDDVVVINRFGFKGYENTFDHSKTPIRQAWQLWEDSLKQIPWSNRPDQIDNQNQTVMHSVDQWENAHCAYNAMINITSETETDNRFMITEKTWKAYRSGCLVVNYGPTDVPAYLAKMGFGIWEGFDRCLPTIRKIALIKQIFQRDDLADVYTKHLSMIQHNQNLVNSLDFIKKQAEPCINKLGSLL